MGLRKDPRGAAWPRRLTAALGRLVFPPMLVAIAVDEGKPFLSLYGLGISFAILLCLAMLLAGLFWRHVSVQSISVSPAGIHAVVWLSMRIGLPRRYPCR